MRYLIAVAALALFAVDSRACDSPRVSRGGFFARVFAAERIVATVPLRIVTAPRRVVSGFSVQTRTTYSSSSRTVVKVAPPVAPCPAGGCPVPKKVEKK